METCAKGAIAYIRPQVHNTPEGKLFLAVLNHARNDALKLVSDFKLKDETVTESRRAVRYLTQPNKGFNAICDLMGINPRPTRALFVKEFKYYKLI